MSLHYDESRPSPLQHQFSEIRRKFRADIAAKAKTRADAGLKLEKTIEITPVEHIAAEPISGPPSYWEIPSLWNMTIPALKADPANKIPDLLDRVHTVREIQDAVCKASKVGRNDLLSSRRAHNIVNPRHVAVALCNILTRESKVGIGRLFNGKDHSTISHSIEKMRPVMEKIETIIATAPLSIVAQAALRECFRIYPSMVCNNGARR